MRSTRQLGPFLALALFGCDRIAEFDTALDEAYCGQITLGSGYRTGLSPRVQMRLTFDSSQLDVGGSPGRLSTYDAGQDGAKRRLLSDAELRPISALANDPLSQLEFGDGRDRNYIFGVTPADNAAESLVAFVSLRTDNLVEVRLLRASQASEPGREPLFGLFTLARKKGDCGF